MADFRLRIRFAKQGAAIWLSHLEVVRAMERCVRRSGLPYAISQGFSPHMKHAFSAALPVGTGSTCEFMDVDLESLVDPEQACQALQAVQHECLPVLSTCYAAKDEPSLQVYFNYATYLIEIEDIDGTLVPELARRLEARGQIEVMKKGKPKIYDLSQYVVEASEVTVGFETSSPKYREADPAARIPITGIPMGMQAETIPGGHKALSLSLLSRPEGSLRPEVILAALAEPDLSPKITLLTRVALESREL